MTHIAIQQPEDAQTVDWHEHVADEQYLAQAAWHGDWTAGTDQ